MHLQSSRAIAETYTNHSLLVRVIALASRKSLDVSNVFALADTAYSIAYMEMRILMAKFLYNFDFELAYPDDNWVSTKKAFGAWNNSGLKLRLNKAVS